MPAAPISQSAPGRDCGGDHPALRRRLGECFGVCGDCMDAAWTTRDNRKIGKQEDMKNGKQENGKIGKWDESEEGKLEDVKIGK